MEPNKEQSTTAKNWLQPWREEADKANEFLQYVHTLRERDQVLGASRQWASILDTLPGVPRSVPPPTYDALRYWSGCIVRLQNKPEGLDSPRGLADWCNAVRRLQEELAKLGLI